MMVINDNNIFRLRSFALHTNSFHLTARGVGYVRMVPALLLGPYLPDLFAT